MRLGSRTLLLASIIASFARSSAADQTLTKTMDALSTGSGDEGHADVAAEEKAEVRGIRKRWASKASSMAEASSGALECDATDLFGLGVHECDTFEPPKKVTKAVQSVDRITVVDAATDDFLVKTSSKVSKSQSLGHKHERDALICTDLSLFKFPWEKGRLGKIFSPKPAIHVPVPKLQSGGRNVMHVDLTVGDSGQMSVKTVLKPEPVQTAAFLQVVTKVEDIKVMDEKAKRRKLALEGFWNLLSFSICSSSVGLKVTVEATADTVVFWMPSLQ